MKILSTTIQVYEPVDKSAIRKGTQRLWPIFLGLLMPPLLIQVLIPTVVLWASFPSLCTVVKAPQFRKCLNLSTSVSQCGFPPRPCIHFKYNIPMYFIEVTETKETFFKELPLVQSQLQLTKGTLPLVTEEDEGGYSYHGHTINVPFVGSVFNALPCHGAPLEQLCFSAMSEHLGRLWRTGEADLWQPSFLAWSASPKACLLKGAVEKVYQRNQLLSGLETRMGLET